MTSIPHSRVNARAPKHRCFWCNIWLCPYANHLIYGRTIDHVVPTSKGGRDSRRNRVWSCLGCNRRKADAMPSAKALKSLKITLDDVMVTV